MGCLFLVDSKKETVGGKSSRGKVILGVTSLELIFKTMKLDEVTLGVSDGKDGGALERREAGEEEPAAEK
jgi:hypothetical protein